MGNGVGAPAVKVGAKVEVGTCVGLIVGGLVG